MSWQKKSPNIQAKWAKGFGVLPGVLGGFRVVGPRWVQRGSLGWLEDGSKWVSSWLRARSLGSVRTVEPDSDAVSGARVISICDLMSSGAKEVERQKKSWTTCVGLIL